MIDPAKRKAIYYLCEQGMPIRKIARELQVDRNTVRSITRQQGEVPISTRSDKIELCPELISRLYVECEGFAQRIHEKLTEEQGIEIGYSTLTTIIRDLELRNHASRRCEQVPDEPGREMQHDTSEYKVNLATGRVKLIGSLLYFRYSKVRYLKFYRFFNRFTMKCFFHEALMYWNYSCPFGKPAMTPKN